MDLKSRARREVLAGDGAMLDFSGVQMHKADDAGRAILYGRLLIQK